MSIVSETKRNRNAVFERARTRRTNTEPPMSSVWDLADLPPNHHGDARQFGGVFGYLAGLTMLFGRRRDARLVAQLAGLTTTDRVVDIGCGPGTAVRVAASHGARVIGVDPSPPMLRLARLSSVLRRGPGETRWVGAKAEDLTLPDGSHTVCWSLASVHHWPDLGTGIAETARVLVPGGRFIALEARTQAGASGRASHGWTPAQAVRFAKLLSEFGFDDARVEDHDLGRRRVVVVIATSPVPTNSQSTAMSRRT